MNIVERMQEAFALSFLAVHARIIGRILGHFYEHGSIPTLSLATQESWNYFWGFFAIYFTVKILKDYLSDKPWKHNPFYANE